MPEQTNGRSPVATRPRGVPEKPGLEGLEPLWSARWERRRAPTRSTATRRRERVFSIDTPPATVSGSLHIGHVFSYTHTDTVARFQRMRGQGRLLSDRVGRQRPAHRAPRAELLRRPLRPEPPLRPRLRAPGPRRASTRSRSRDPTSWRSASSSPPRTSRSSSSCGAPSGSRWTGRTTYATISERARRRVPAWLPATSPSGVRSCSGRPRPSGTSTSGPR